MNPKFMPSVLEIPNVQIVLISPKDYEILCQANPHYYKNTELFEGMIVQKMTKSARHSFYKYLLTNAIQSLLPKGYFLRNEDVLLLGNSELEPDISVIKGSFLDYKDIHPTTARLVVEISFSSLQYDREKAKVYAKGNVEEYWIVDIENEQIEVYTNPQEGRYATVKNYLFGEQVPLFDSFVVVEK